MKSFELQKSIRAARASLQSAGDDPMCSSSCSSPSSSVTDDETKSKKSKRLQSTIDKIRQSLVQKDEDSSGHGSLNETESEEELDEIIDVVTI